MKVILISVGTRGDIEPFLAIAEMLQLKGHETICCFPEQFRDLTIEAGHDFVGLSADFLELLDSRAGKIAMGSKATIFEKIGAYYSLYKQSLKVNKKLVKRQSELIEEVNPDRVVYNIKSIYPLLWSIENLEKAVLISPIPYLVHTTKDHAHIGFNKNYGETLNKLSYGLSNFGLIKNVMAVTKGIRKTKPATSKQLKNALFKSKMAYTVSPSVFPRPSYWSKNVQVLGYHERNRMNSLGADEQLKTFITEHDKILFVTFGSMTNENPKEKTAIILDIVQHYTIPTIINTSAGGLLEPETYDRNLVHFVRNIPYEWIFPKVHVVIHHGGSGTTHTALKYACPSLIIPHIIDQFMWRNVVHDLGVGPKGIAIKKMNKKGLERKLLDLYQNTVYKESAKQISEQMKEENYSNQLYEFIINSIIKKESSQLNYKRNKTRNDGV